MGFDWRAFAEGFAETAAANIKEKSKEARQYRLDQEQLAKDNIMKISRRNSVVNEVLGLTNYLEDQGVSTAQMQAAISSGPKAIQDLATKVQAAVKANAGKKLSDTEESFRQLRNTINHYTLVGEPEELELEDDGESHLRGMEAFAMGGMDAYNEARGYGVVTSDD